MRSLTRRILARFGYVKAVPVSPKDRAARAQMLARVGAAEEFVNQWADLASSLVYDYTCTLTCSEAETLADLFRQFGYYDTAETVISAHAEHDDDCDDAHHTPCEHCTDDDSTAPTTDELLALMNP